MRHHRPARVGAVFAVLLAAAGCRSLPAEHGDAARVALLVPASERQVWEPLALAFEARHPGTHVELVEGPNSTDLRDNLYTTALLAEDDTFDLVLMDVTWTPKYAAAGWLLPLERRFPRDEVDALWSAAVDVGRYRGHLYRLPTRTDVGVLFYRRDLLDEAGLAPPETFGDLVRLARELQRPPERWGFVWQGSQYEGLICVFLEVLQGHGGFWIRPDTLDVGLDAPEALAALEFLRRSRSEWNVSPPGVTTYKEEESRRLFQDGRAVLLRNWPYVWRLAQAADSPLAGKVGVRSMVHESGGVSAGTLGGWGLGISRFSRRPDLAAAFIGFAISLEGQRLLCARSGYAPARREAYEDPDLLAANPFLADLQRLHDNAVARPAIARYAEVSDILQRHLSAALAGLTSSDRALRAAARETRVMLQSSGARP
ncbi:MAG: ABC transporter substrate-binding protein [Vicinamibacterales bacterium]